jgi:curved DNA-binding protein
MEYKDYYQILGVSRDASREEIKRAYRKLARKYHPDVSKEANAEARFKEINEAHEVLHDPEKRAAYDQLGTGWHAGQEFRPPPGGAHYRSTGAGMGPDDLSGFSDFFASIFGGRGFEGGFGAGADFRGFDAQGQDQHARIRLSLEEAYQGVTRNLQLESTEVDAQGRVSRRPRSLKVRIPAGATEGRRIRLAGQGGRGREGHPNGDLYLEVELLPHRFFRAEGRDVYLELPVAPWEAALGATVPVPTLGGTVNLRIPAGSQSGNKLRLKGRGLPGRPPGDEYVVLQVRVPEASGEAARRLYREMAEQLAFNPRAELGV